MNLLEFLQQTEEVLYPVPEDFVLEEGEELPPEYVQTEEGIFEVKQVLRNNTSYENTHGYFLVFSETLKNNLVSANSLQPDNVQVSPVSLSDGRYAIPADLLSETKNNGLYEAGFNGLNKENFPQVEVIDLQELQSLLPVVEEVV